MPTKSTNTAASIFAAARKKAHLIYDKLWYGDLGGDGYHRVHISPRGKVTYTPATNRGSTDEAEYFHKPPYTLTLWEIDAQQEQFEPEERMGEAYFKLRKMFITGRHLPEDESEWSAKDSKAFLRKCVDVYKRYPSAYPYDKAEKKARFAAWRKQHRPKSKKRPKSS